MGKVKILIIKFLNIRYKIDYSIFDFKYKDIKRKNRKIKNIKLKLLGKHNVLNAAAAIAICLNLGVSQNIIKNSLKEIFWCSEKNDKNI